MANLLGWPILLFEEALTWIKVGGMEGTVEDVGFRSTRIGSFLRFSGNHPEQPTR